MIIPKFRIERQLMSKWCWAAVGSSISYYYAHFTESMTYWTQYKIVNAAFPEIDCKEAPLKCNEPYALEIVLQGIEHLNQNIESAVHLHSIKNEIDSLRPMCCHIRLKNDKSHFIVIYGYEDDKVFIADPELCYYRILYRNFVVGYRGGIWVRTYSTQPKID